ncbi:MAG: exodeoxyribonuclease VII small subunit [Lachnospiraceae bacterium]
METDWKELTIEQSMEKISQIIAALEGGSLTLEESMQQFETGIRLVNQCTKIIDTAEKQMKILRESEGETDVFADNAGKNESN